MTQSYNNYESQFCRYTFEFEPNFNQSHLNAPGKYK